MIFLAHGIGGVRDLPVPKWLFYWGGGVVLAVSFVALGVLWQQPILDQRAIGRALSRVASRALLGPVRVGVQVVSVALLCLVFAASLFGTTSALENLAPTWIYVVFWLGVPFLSVLCGNVWTALSPWRAVADGTVWLMRRTGRDPRPLALYPERLGRWPAAIAIFGFSTMELAYSDPSSPRMLAFAIAIYTYLSLVGMAAFGRDTWSGRGEGFAVLFALFARVAPLYVVEGRIRARLPLTGLGGVDPVPGTAAFVAVMLGSVAFDGFSRTVTWQDWLINAEAPYIVNDPGTAELIGIGLSLLALVVFSLLAAVSFRVACLVTETICRRPRLVPEFVLSLVPIAFVYEVAHYFSLAILQGQFTLPLLSDPFGKGWNLIGASDIQPNLALLTPNTVWYVQVAALIVGHVCGLAIAHDRALTLFPRRHDAIRSQLALLGLMVLYTVGGLWLLSRG